jgi:uncharacterized protein YuzE
MDEFTYDYSQHSDILHIHRKNNATIGSVEIGDFTIDFGKGNKVVGLEIEHASEFFANLDIDKESLSKIEDVQIIVDKKNLQSQLIFLAIKFPETIKKISVPLTITA